MSQEEKTVDTDRRSFLKLATVGAATGGAAAALGAGDAEAAAPTSPTAAGYRETDHVKTVYNLARF